MQTITISGNLGKDPELRTLNNGDKVLGFSVGVRQGYGDRSSTNWFRCSVFGKRGESLERHLRKGMKVVVQGELTIGEYQGKPQFDVRANEVEFMSAGERQTEPAQQSRGGGGGTSYEELEDDVPYLTSGPVRGHRNI